MEILLFITFFLVALIFFVVGKDDFGRKPLKTKTVTQQRPETKEEEKPEAKEPMPAAPDMGGMGGMGGMGF